MNGDGIDGVTLFDGIDDILTFGDFAEDGVLAIEPGGSDVGDEKLASVGSGACVGHGENTGNVMLEVGAAFVFKFVAGTTATCSCRVSALNHEVGDDAVEGDAVIKSLVCQIEEIGGSDGSFGGKDGKLDVSLVGVKCDIFVRSHGVML